MVTKEMKSDKKDGGKDDKTDFAAVVTSILEKALATRKGFTPEVVMEFEEVGRTSREQQMLGTTPSRRGVVASKTGLVSSRVTTKAIEEAVDLAERLELATKGHGLNLRDWVG